VITHFAILRLDAVVVPVNPMNRTEELKHYILDPDTKVAVTTADLAPELAAASNVLEKKERLQHLLVTQLQMRLMLPTSAPKNCLKLGATG
jgi:fatty-acyl-CoA synthase